MILQGVLSQQRRYNRAIGNGGVTHGGYSNTRNQRGVDPDFSGDNHHSKQQNFINEVRHQVNHSGSHYSGVPSNVDPLNMTSSG